MKEKIKQKAKELGFDLIGFTSPKLDKKFLEAYAFWLEKGFEGKMQYMRKAEKRRNILEVLPGAKTVICLGINYFKSQSPLKQDSGRIARYAFGKDYHKIIKNKLKKLKNFIQLLEPASQNLDYVDTGPILEKAYAQQAGLGFIGKNSCLISKKYGSWIFLAEILSTIQFKPDKPVLNKNFENCGSCTLCMRACPMQAIIAPGVINAGKCVSYLTIENRLNPIPKSSQRTLKRIKRLFGCDICQEVCPHNSQKPVTRCKELLIPEIAGDQQSINGLLMIKNHEEYCEKFAGSPLMRPKLEGIQQTCKILKSD